MRLAAREQESRTMHANFPALGKHAGDVRRLLMKHLARWDWLDVINDTLLVANEVFVNAVEHGSQRETDTVSVEVDCTADTLRVAITDSSRSLPRPRVASGFAVGGRGLALVEALSDRWGADLTQDGSGKQVWFTLSHSSTP
ncbi:ATP-binding protein [Streptomyces sp. NPDC048275]|uniref:ATP-binding protein n=1 Tax=Streptomyces sp. NPDC048275 TaxID=3155629 RepID=UPI0033E2CDA6